MVAGNGTVEDLQTFTSTPAPAPAWVLVHSVHIPPQTLSRAADTLSDYLGPEGIELAGGKSWWRQRLEAKQDLHAEWIAMKRDWDGSGLKRHKQQHQPHFKKPAHEPDQPYTSDIDDLRCMYYVCKVNCSLELLRPNLLFLRSMGADTVCASLFNGQPDKWLMHLRLRFYRDASLF